MSVELERVGRTSVEAACEAVVGEDLAALGEAVVGEDPTALGEDLAVVTEEWTRAAGTQ
jgi:hypothetical protein